jgi:hypothetical protein
MESYDIRYGNDLENRLDVAFGEGPAHNDITLHIDDVALEDRMFGDQSALTEWLALNWHAAYYGEGNTDHLYLAGVNDIWPRIDWAPGGVDFPDSAAGITVPLGGHQEGDLGCASLVLMGYLEWLLDADDLWPAVMMNATHELGHARAGLSHADEGATRHLHDTAYKCVMSLMHLKANGDLIPDYDYFCDSCLLRISVSPWP